MSKGYVYVLSNASMPGLVKIGWSGSGATHRAKSLNNTSVPSSFAVEFEIMCLDAPKAEDRAHRAAYRHRVTGRREFFRMSVRDAVCHVIDAARVDWDRLGDRKPEYWQNPYPVLTKEQDDARHQTGLKYLRDLKARLDELDAPVLRRDGK